MRLGTGYRFSVAAHALRAYALWCPTATAFQRVLHKDAALVDVGGRPGFIEGADGCKLHSSFDGVDESDELVMDSYHYCIVPFENESWIPRKTVVRNVHTVEQYKN
jgi:hypothetical protein